jgi:DNA polymerase III delta prime subunit
MIRDKVEIKSKNIIFFFSTVLLRRIYNPIKPNIAIIGTIGSMYRPKIE